MLAPSRRPTEVWTALSSRRSPQLDSGSVCSQSPLCSAVTANSRALSTLSLKLFTSASCSEATTTLSHADCLHAAAPDGLGAIYYYYYYYYYFLFDIAYGDDGICIAKVRATSRSLRTLPYSLFHCLLAMLQYLL